MSGNDKSKPVGYVFSKECFELLNAVQKYAGRASKVHSLIESYGLLHRMSILRPIPASDDELLQFHSSDYLELIKRWSGEEIVTPRERGGDDDDYDGGGDDDDDLFTKIFGEDLKILEDYGFCYDCPPMRNTLPFIRHIAGSSITAARMVADGKMDCVVNWFGGWHHAKKSNASRYCYVNDIVLCIIELLKKFDKVLYIDLDLHHGDGVEEAFFNSARIMKLSFHKFKDGFFPGSGSIDDKGCGKGLNHNVNVPLQEGLDDEMFCGIFDQVFAKITEVYPYQVIVCQSGCDTLSGDPMKGFNWTERSYIHVVKRIRDAKVPAIFLGGGGYNFLNVARCWTIITAALCGVDVDSHIPEHEQFFTEYKPGFDLSIDLLPMFNRNQPKDVNKIIDTIKDNLHPLNSKLI